MFLDILDSPVFHERLLEVVSWCCGRQADDLRSTALYSPAPGHEYAFLQFNARHRQFIVADVADRRAASLRASGQYPLDIRPESGAGRILAFNPDFSLFDGAAEAASDGFIDWANIPAWDTWICYVVEPEPVLQPLSNSWSSYLLSWVPPELVAAVDDAIDVNPEQCVLWAKHMNRN